MNKSPPENNAIDVKFNPGPYLCIFFLNGSSFLTERSEKNKKWEKKPLIHTAIHYKFNNLLRRSLCLEVFTVRWATKKQNCLTTVYQQPSNSCICEVRTQCSHFQVFLDKFSSQDYRVNTIYFIKGSSAFPWVQPREEFGGRGFGFVHLGFKNKAIFLQYSILCLQLGTRGSWSPRGAPAVSWFAHHHLYIMSEPLSSRHFCVIGGLVSFHVQPTAQENPILFNLITQELWWLRKQPRYGMFLRINTNKHKQNEFWAGFLLLPFAPKEHPGHDGLGQHNAKQDPKGNGRAQNSSKIHKIPKELALFRHWQGPRAAQLPSCARWRFRCS